MFKSNHFEVFFSLYIMHYIRSLMIHELVLFCLSPYSMLLRDFPICILTIINKILYFFFILTKMRSFLLGCLIYYILIYYIRVFPCVLNEFVFLFIEVKWACSHLPYHTMSQSHHYYSAIQIGVLNSWGRIISDFHFRLSDFFWNSIYIHIWKLGF